MRRLLCRLSAVAGLLLVGAAPPPPAPTPAAVLAAAPAGAWARVAPDDLLVMELGNGARVAIALAPEFAPLHVAAVRRLARAGWYAGTAVQRVQDNYVTQWGDAGDASPPPAGAVLRLPAEADRPAAGLALVPLPYRDSFAPRVGLVRGFPAAAAGGRAWPVHCYGMVGVGRELAPDTGDGRELYAVIGHAPRALDRNIALVGRVVAGMEALAALPRGTGEMGFYATPAERLAVRSIRLAADLPAGQRPAFEWLRPDSASFRAWVQARANRQDAFFTQPAGAIDLCNALPPVRPVAR